MVSDLTSFFASNITQSIESASYVAIFILMTLESALVPIPSEITMPFAGFLVGQDKLSFWLVVTVGASAHLFGSLLAYALGWWGGRAVVHRFVRDFGKYILISVDEVGRAEHWFRKYGELITFGSRLLPVVRTFISLPAGIARMDVKKFSIYTFAGSFIWSTFLTYIGVVLGQNWASLEVYFRQFQLVIAAIFVVAALFYLYHKIKKLRRRA